jgi:hypothetical protein
MHSIQADMHLDGVVASRARVVLVEPADFEILHEAMRAAWLTQDLAVLQRARQWCSHAADAAPVDSWTYTSWLRWSSKFDGLIYAYLAPVDGAERE